MFSQATTGKVTLRASEGGETLVELVQADDVYWLDNSNVMAVRSSSGFRLLDLTTGDQSLIPISDNSFAVMPAPVPGQPNRHNFFVHRGVDQVEISKVSGRFEARLVAEKRTQSGLGFATNTGGMSADGKLWLDGHQGMRIIKLDTLELQEISIAPIGSQAAWPTANPDEFILALAVPSGDGITSLISYYVYYGSVLRVRAVEKRSPACRDPPHGSRAAAAPPTAALRVSAGRLAQRLLGGG